MDIVNAILAEQILPPLDALGYQYVVAGNGLFIRAEDSRLAALVPIADDLTLHGLVALEPVVTLKLPRVPEQFLRALLGSARRHLPNETMYQFTYNGPLEGWTCRMPRTAASPTSLHFDDDGQTVIDLHSHGSMDAFFSGTDDSDENGLRVYCVIGKVDTETPEILCRVGVYGHHCVIRPETIFQSLGPFSIAPDSASSAEPPGIYDEPSVVETASGLLVAHYA